jgi:hypothetical protein
MIIGCGWRSSAVPEIPRTEELEEPAWERLRQQRKARGLPPLLVAPIAWSGSQLLERVKKHRPAARRGPRRGAAAQVPC